LLKLLVIFEYIIILGAPLLLLLSGSEVIRTRSKAPFTLVLISISSAWMLLSLAWNGTFGPFYSTLRSYVLLGNLILMLICGVLSIAIRTQRSARSSGAAFLLSFVWFITLAISYAV
jgi:hypothetical protein